MKRGEGKRESKKKDTRHKVSTGVGGNSPPERHSRDQKREGVGKDFGILPEKGQERAAKRIMENSVHAESMN